MPPAVVTVQLPEGLARYCDRRREHSAEGASVRLVVEDLVRRFPDLGPRVLEDNGRLRAHLMVFCNGDSLPRDQLDADLLASGDALTLMFLAGGG